MTKMKRLESMSRPISLAEIFLRLIEKGRQDGFLDAPRDFGMILIDYGDGGVMDRELGATNETAAGKTNSGTASTTARASSPTVSRPATLAGRKMVI